MKTQASSPQMRKDKVEKIKKMFENIQLIFNSYLTRTVNQRATLKEICMCDSHSYL